MIKSFKIVMDEFGYPETVELNGVELPSVAECDSPTGEHGCCKDVYIGDDYVVKFGNMVEAEFLPEERHRKHFALVVFADINREWYIQERVNCVPNAPFTHVECELINDLAYYYAIGDLSCNLCEDFGDSRHETHNWINDINGIPVIYDYSSD